MDKLNIELDSDDDSEVIVDLYNQNEKANNNLVKEKYVVSDEESEKYKFKEPSL